MKSEDSITTNSREKIVKYFWYRIISEGFEMIGVIEFWVRIICLTGNEWTMLKSGIIMLVLFGIQSKVNKTKYVENLKKTLCKNEQIEQ